MDGFVEQVYFVFVVDYGNHVVETVAKHHGNVFDVLRTLETVADNENILGYQLLVIKLLNKVDVERRRGFEVDVVFKHLLQNKREMRTFGAVAVVVSALVVHLGNGHVEKAFGTLYLRAYLRQIGNFQRRAVLLYYLHQRYVVEIQFVVDGFEFVLRIFKRLVNQIDVLVFHFFKCNLIGLPVFFQFK